MDEKYSGAPNFFTIEKLLEHERSQIGNLVMRVADTVQVADDLLAKRLERIRVLTVDSNSTFQYANVGGEFKDGLAIVAASRLPELGNHILLHEVGHGLVATGTIAEFGGSVNHFSGGLTSQFLANGATLPTMAVPNLNRLKRGSGGFDDFRHIRS